MVHGCVSDICVCTLEFIHFFSSVLFMPLHLLQCVPSSPPDSFSSHFWTEKMMQAKKLRLWWEKSSFSQTFFSGGGGENSRKRTFKSFCVFLFFETSSLVPLSSFNGVVCGSGMCETDWFRMNIRFWLRKFSKFSVLMLVLNVFHPVRNFWLRCRVENCHFDNFGCDFEIKFEMIIHFSPF